MVRKGCQWGSPPGAGLNSSLERVKHFNWHLPQNSKLSARISSLCSFSLGSSCHPGWSPGRTGLLPGGCRHGVQGFPLRPVQNLRSPFTVDANCLEGHQGMPRSFHLATVSFLGPERPAEEFTSCLFWRNFWTLALSAPTSFQPSFKLGLQKIVQRGTLPWDPSLSASTYNWKSDTDAKKSWDD